MNKIIFTVFFLFLPSLCHAFGVIPPNVKASCPAGSETAVCSTSNNNCGSYERNNPTKYIRPGILHDKWGYLCGKAQTCPSGFNLKNGECVPLTCTPPQITNIVVNNGVPTASCITPEPTPVGSDLCPSGQPKFNGSCQVCFQYNPDGSCLSPNQCPSGEVNQGILNGQAICTKTCSDPNQSYGVFNGVEGCYGAPTCPNPSDSFGSVNGVYGCYGSDGTNNGGNSSSTPTSSPSTSSASGTGTSSGTSSGSGSGSGLNSNSVGANYSESESCPSGFVKDGLYCVNTQGDCQTGYHQVVVSRTPFYYMCVANQSSSSSSNSSVASSVASSSAASSVASSITTSSGTSASATSTATSASGTSAATTSAGTATASTCNSEPSCNGDAVQCAILKQSWINNCDGKEKVIPINAEADNATIESEFNELVSNNKTDLESDGTIKGISRELDLSNVTDDIFNMAALADSASSGTCPVPRVLNLHLGTFEMSYQPLCDLAEGISHFVILISSMFASLIIFRTIQGS